MKQTHSFVYTRYGVFDRLITEVRLGKPHDILPLDATARTPPIGKYNAIWDTGAGRTYISPTLFCTLALNKLKPLDYDPGDGVPTEIFIRLPDTLDVPKFRVFVKELDLEMEKVDMVLGMDIIRNGDFFLSHFHGKMSFAFSSPHMFNCLFKPVMGYSFYEHHKFVDLAIRTPIAIQAVSKTKGLLSPIISADKSSGPIYALLDTGRVQSCVSKELLPELGLLLGPKGQVYNVNIELLSGKVMIPSLNVTARTLRAGISLLLGMDVIKSSDFIITRPADDLCAFFCYPPNAPFDIVTWLEDPEEL